MVYGFGLLLQWQEQQTGRQSLGTGLTGAISHHHDEDVVFCVLMSIHKLVGIKIILDHSLCELLLWFLYHSIHLLTSKRL